LHRMIKLVGAMSASGPIADIGYCTHIAGKRLA
jgi:hypothetical protein